MNIGSGPTVFARLIEILFAVLASLNDPQSVVMCWSVTGRPLVEHKSNIVRLLSLDDRPSNMTNSQMI